MEYTYYDLPDDAQSAFNWFCRETISEKRMDAVERLADFNFDYSECKSPIEVIFCVGFDLLMTIHNNCYSLKRQYEVRIDENTRYFLDFAYISEGIKIAIECDGHEFHEKTKEQVRYGNNRDYNLKMNGYDVIHFSGSEIVENPFGCARKAASLISAKIKERRLKDGEGELLKTSQENA